MAVSALLERIVTRRKTVEKQRDRTYTEIVEAVARGEEPKDDEIDQAIDSAGRTVEQFSADVERRAERIQWRAMVDALPDLRNEWKKLRAKRDALSAELDQRIKEIRSELGDQIDGIDREINSVHGRISEHETAQRRLIATADKAIAEELAAKQKELQAEKKKLGYAVERHDRLTQRAEKLREQADEMGRTAEETRDMVQDAAGYEKKAGEWEGKLPELRANVEQLESEVAAIEARKLEP